MQGLKSAEKITTLETGSNSSILLPKSFEKMIISWPELKPLLTAFALRDHGTFMHSVAVHYSATRLSEDLFLFTQPNLKSKQALINRSPFWMLHDIGKTAADSDMEVAQFLVHPRDNFNRPTYQKARHWLHPQIGGDLIKIWSDLTSKRIKPFARKWAQLAHSHDHQLNPYLKVDNKKISKEDKLALLIFSLCDATMAIALSRPNRPGHPDKNYIRQVLHKKLLDSKALSKLFPNQNLNLLRNYIITSIFNSLDSLQQNYPESVWVKPTTISNHNFKINDKTSQQKTHMLDTLVIQTWHDCEKFWQSTIANLITDGVF